MQDGPSASLVVHQEEIGGELAGECDSLGFSKIQVDEVRRVRFRGVNLKPIGRLCSPRANRCWGQLVLQLPYDRFGNRNLSVQLGQQIYQVNRNQIV